MKKDVAETVVENGYSSEYLQEIENSRKDFLKKYKHHDSLKKVVFGVCFAGMIVLLFVGPSLNMPSAAQLGLPFILLAIMLIYSFVVKRSIDKKMKDYFSTYYNCTNKFTLDDKGIENVTLLEPGKITKEEFIQNGLYKDVYEVGSRGLTSFTHNGCLTFLVDCAAQVKGDKKILPCYVGKYLFSDAKYDGNDRIIVYLKGEGTVLPPTNIDGLTAVENNDQFIIYTENKHWEKVLTPAVVKAISAIKTNKLLVDLSICIYSGKQYVCMGYDDPLMVPPLQNDFDARPTEQFKKELKLVLKLMKELR